MISDIPIFVDTSCWLALVNASDSLHEHASVIYEKLVAQQRRFMTHQAVLLETGNGLASYRLRPLAINLKAKLETSEIVEVIEVTKELYEAGWKLYANRPDKDWGIVDCISFVLMERENVAEALTADHHFEQAGFIKLL